MKRLSWSSLIAVMAGAAIGIAVPGVRLLADTPEFRPDGDALHKARAVEFARLMAKAQAEGEVHVIVQWDVPDYEALSTASIAAANGSIASVSDARLAEAIGAIAEAELGRLDGIPHSVNRTFATLPYAALTVSEDGLEALEASPGVLDIDEDRLARPLLNNTVNITGASAAWDLGYDGTGYYVAVLDTGIRDTHAFFGGKDIVQACFARGEDYATGVGDCPNGLSSDTSSPNAAEHHATWPYSDHGTWTTGIATGNGPHNPGAGIAKGADIIAVQVFSQFYNDPDCNPPGSDCVFSWSSDQLAALQYVYTLRNSYNIASINMSLGGGKYTSDASCDASNSAMKTVIDNLRSAGIATVIASGNEGYCDGLSAPGCISSAIAVGATWDSDDEWGGSNYEEDMLELFAPGVSVLSSEAGSDSDYGSATGTSGAAPHVAGAWAVLRHAVPNATVDMILSALQSTGAIVDPHCAGGTPPQRRIQIDAALIELLPSVRSCDLNELIASDAEAGAAFGHAVATGGELAIVGAHKDPCLAGSQCGAAYVYRWNLTAPGPPPLRSWDEEQKLTASDAGSGDKFGTSVSIGEDVALVGAPSDDDGGETDAGSAYVFRYGGVTWIEEQKLTAPVAGQGVEFGTAVAVEGDVAVVGAPGEGGSGGIDGPGAAFVFRYGGSTWSLEQTLTAADGTDGDGFGKSVSLSGTTVIVGAQSVACGAGSSCGAAYVFKYGGGTWNQEQKLVASDPQSYDWFGWSVSVDGSQAMVGAPLADCSETVTNCGSVYIFERSGSTWTEVDNVTIADSKASDYVGWSVAIRNDIGLAGSHGVDCAEGDNCGVAYLIRPNDEGSWKLDTRFRMPDPDGGDNFGTAVALGEVALFLGADGHDSLGLGSSGAAYAYAYPGDCNSNGVADTCDILTGFSLDVDPEDNRPDECLCVESSPAEPERLDLQFSPVSQKIRYLSFHAGDEGMLQGVRVSFQSIPGDYSHWTGTRLWVQQPQEYCENAGVAQLSPCPPAVGGLPSMEFWGARLGCDPYWTDWSQYDIVHVWDEGIVPDGVFDIQVVENSCPLAEEDGYSTAMTLTQSAWADLIQDCSTTPCKPPDGSTGIVDVTAILDKWKNLPGNVQKVRADIEGSPAGDHRIPDQSINITDVTYCLGAFLGDTYPGPGFPAPGNPPTCSP